MRLFSFSYSATKEPQTDLKAAAWGSKLPNTLVACRTLTCPAGFNRTPFLKIVCYTNPMAGGPGDPVYRDTFAFVHNLRQVLKQPSANFWLTLRVADVQARAGCRVHPTPPTALGMGATAWAAKVVLYGNSFSSADKRGRCAFLYPPVQSVLWAKFWEQTQPSPHQPASGWRDSQVCLGLMILRREILPLLPRHLHAYVSDR